MPDCPGADAETGSSSASIRARIRNDQAQHVAAVRQSTLGDLGHVFVYPVSPTLVGFRGHLDRAHQSDRRQVAIATVFRDVPHQLGQHGLAQGLRI